MQTINQENQFTGQDILTIKCAVQAIVPIYQDLLVWGRGSTNRHDTVFTELPIGKGYGAVLRLSFEDKHIIVTAYYTIMSATVKTTNYDRPVKVYKKETNLKG